MSPSWIFVLILTTLLTLATLIRLQRLTRGWIRHEPEARGRPTRDTAVHAAPKR